MLVLTVLSGTIAAGPSSASDLFPEQHFEFDEAAFHAGTYSVPPWSESRRRAVIRALAAPDRDALLAALVPSVVLAGEAWFDLRGLVLSRGDQVGALRLQRLVLDFADFSDVSLSRADFSRSLIRGARFTNVEMSRADFDNAFLSCTTIAHSTLTSATFRLTQFGRHFLLTDSVADEARFDHARNLGSVSITSTSAKRAIFVGAEIAGGKLTKSNFTEADFSSANLGGADFFGSNISSAVFSEASLRGSRLNRVSVEAGHVRLFRAVLDGAFFGDTDIGGFNVSYLTWEEGSRIGEETEADSVIVLSQADRVFKRRLYSQAETIYRALGEEFRRLGYRSEYLSMRFRALESRRKVLWQSERPGVMELVALEASLLLDRHGTSWPRLLVNVTIVIVGFAALHFLTWVIFATGAEWRVVRLRRRGPQEQVLTLGKNGYATGRRRAKLWLFREALILSAESFFVFADKVANVPGLLGIVSDSKEERLVPKGVCRTFVAVQGIVGLALALIALNRLLVAWFPL